MQKKNDKQRTHSTVVNNGNDFKIDIPNIEISSNAAIYLSK